MLETWRCMTNRDRPREGESAPSANETPTIVAAGDRPELFETEQKPRVTGIAMRHVEQRLRQRLLGEPAEPTRVGRFTLERELGSGGMGTVWIAYDDKLGRKVALKFLHEGGADDRGEQRMVREAKGLARLSHPNVVPVYDVGRHEGRVWLAMEYVPGRTLRSWVREDGPARSDILDAWVAAGRGLAAIHRAGLIHRDIKPDNVLIGDDGRVRIVDFGLVRAAGSAEEMPKRTGRTAATRPEPALRFGDEEMATEGGYAPGRTTQTGELLGTPAYMAPEQFLAEVADSRTDQFNYCASLYEALYGERPYTGETFPRLYANVTAGELRDPPPGAATSRWIYAALVRGLSREPDDRFPSMDDLLEALSDDPGARRRRALTRGGVVLLIAIVCTALAFAIRKGRERWSEQQRQARAHERLAAQDERLDALVAAGKHEDARRAFDVFSRQPEQRDTAALGLGWLHHAERESIAGYPDEAVDAFAMAYAIASSGDHRQAALRGLVGQFHELQRWDELALALVTFDRFAETRSEDSTAGEHARDVVLPARLDSLLMRRDLGGALALAEGPGGVDGREGIAPLLRALAGATRSDHRALGRLLGVDSGQLVFRSRAGIEFVRPVSALTRQSSITLRAARLHHLAPGETSGLFVFSRRGETVVAQRDGDALSELLRLPEDERPTSSLSADVDGDGKRELYIGTGQYSRRLVELQRAPDGSWSTRAPSPVIDARNSNINGLAAVDLDGDGRIEVIAALGGWSGYEIVVLRHEPASATLVPVTRRKLGPGVHVALARRRDGSTELAVQVLHREFNAEVFPPGYPLAELTGVYRFRLHENTLEQVAFTPQVGVEGGHLIAGDLDGDGNDEIIQEVRTGGPTQGPRPRHTVIHTRATTGAPASFTIGRTKLLGSFDLDEDGDEELILRLTDREGVWVLGSGDARVPVVPSDPPSVVAERVPAGASPVYTRRWRHAQDLAEMGLWRQAADAFVALADLSSENSMATGASLYAAALHERLGQDEQAAELYARTSETARGQPLSTAVDGAVRSLARRGDHVRALNVLDTALARSGALSTEEYARLDRARQQQARLAVGGDLREELRFDTPLSNSWRIDQPLAIHRDSASRSLRIDALVPGVIASVPITWSDERVSLEVELDLHRAEWGSGFTVGLYPEGVTDRKDPSIPLRIAVRSRGGTSSHEYKLACTAFGKSLGSATIPHDASRAAEGNLGRYVVRAVIDYANSEGTCGRLHGLGKRAPLQRPQADRAWYR